MSVEDDALSLLKSFAATLIQAAYRKHRQRQKFLRQKRAAKHIQRCWRRFSWHRAYLNRAAWRIQEAWRNRCRRRLYLFYRDLIRFREGSPPVDLLRCINPREASNIDAFSGIHLRFRFGGSSFPPKILYKIFTHAPVTDICAFCPRDYAAEKESAQLGHRDALLDMTSWYKRWENNGWRPIAERLFVEPEATARQSRAEASQQWFHYCPKVRRQEREAAAKQRKRLWMSKMYKDGVHTEQYDVKEGVKDLDDLGAEADLVQWSNALDFDDYTRSWSTLAASTVSEVACPEPEMRLQTDTWTMNAASFTYSLSSPFKAAATAAAGATSGMLHFSSLTC